MSYRSEQIFETEKIFAKNILILEIPKAAKIAL